MSIKNFNNINDFLSELEIPLLKNKEFYIAKFEDYDFNISSEPFSYKHEYFEISFSIGYDAQVSINDKTSNALDFNISFVSPGQIVTWDLKNIQQESTSYILLFKPEFLPLAYSIFDIYENFSFFNNYTLSSYKLSNSQITLFLNYLESLDQEYKTDSEDSLEIIKSYLNIFLLKIKRELQFSQKVSYLKTRAQEITYNFENLIKQTKYKHQPIKYYAKQLNLSPIYLSECIKKTTNKTAKQIIDEYLILEAKSLLKQSTKSISEIAFSLGFDDNSNFVKYFKNKTGFTPKMYRNP
ncbi:AraC family transcriptional regulator [Tenacibaculum aiptasiae]|uniref:AraC family transcriptional regulator n=1 Tax=Tenacibaculum aiptasiae TaxID=426481 RepID=A0A7J5A9L4_9FLAO|nr:helix-turn-helix domain-containing protein [Tenacibaculum aiptasiae]KAB1154205.1 AraC family transcriptional regulator [Tenacibaculum aiptasiae]